MASVSSMLFFAEISVISSARIRKVCPISHADIIDHVYEFMNLLCILLLYMPILPMVWWNYCILFVVEQLLAEERAPGRLKRGRGTWLSRACLGVV